MKKKNDESYEENYNEVDIDQLRELNYENQSLKNSNFELGNSLSSMNNAGDNDPNLIHYQLETDKILERIEHFLKGDKIKFSENGSYYSEPTKNVLVMMKRDDITGSIYFIQEIEEEIGEEIKEKKNKEIIVKIINKDGSEIDISEKDSEKILKKLGSQKLRELGYRYIEISDEDRKPLNEYGVAEIMRILSMYVTKETFLSTYSEERINEIMGDLGNSLNNFLYCNYEKMGMNTKFKESKYGLIILNILHTVESCYRRALDGSEQEYLRTRAIVTQSQGMGGGEMRKPQVREKWNPLKPSTW